MSMLSSQYILLYRNHQYGWAIVKHSELTKHSQYITCKKAQIKTQ